MTKDEALALALEALEGNTTNPMIDPEQAELEDKAIAAIKQAQQAQQAQEPLYRAAINCPHEIDHDQVVLKFDPKQLGHNALNQLGRRLDAAISAPNHGQAQQVREPEGWKLVPIEPTPDMNAAGYMKNLELGSGKRSPNETYKAMIAAAPNQG